MSKYLTQVSDLIKKIQSRVELVSNRVTQAVSALGVVSAKVDGLLDRERLFTAKVQDAFRESTAALHNLRDSTQEAFDGVKQDMAAALRGLQVQNERLGKAESQISFVKSAEAEFTQLKNRVAAIEDITKSIDEAHVESELRALLSKYGYDVSEVAISRATVSHGGPTTIAVVAKGTK